jgi:hypothetical protein
LPQWPYQSFPAMPFDLSQTLISCQGQHQLIL